MTLACFTFACNRSIFDWPTGPWSSVFKDIVVIFRSAWYVWSYWGFAEICQLYLGWGAEGASPGGQVHHPGEGRDSSACGWRGPPRLSCSCQISSCWSPSNSWWSLCVNEGLSDLQEVRGFSESNSCCAETPSWVPPHTCPGVPRWDMYLSRCV